jgi:hypothetical protein
LKRCHVTLGKGCHHEASAADPKPLAAVFSQTSPWGLESFDFSARSRE